MKLLVLAILISVLGLNLGAAKSYPNFPPGVWQELANVRVDRFIAEGETRSEVIKKLNRSLHKADPHTTIQISFVASPASDHIDETKYARQIHISVHGCTVVDLIQIMSMYDIEWRVTGNKVVASHEIDY